MCLEDKYKYTFLLFSLIWRKHDFNAKHYALQKQITGNILQVKYFKSIVLIYIKYIVS